MKHTKCVQDTTIYSIYGWNKIGKRLIKNNYILPRTKYTVISAISNKKIIHNKIIKGSANAIVFLKFIKNIINGTKEKELYLLMDNTRIHHAKIVKEYIKTTKHKILFNVPYMPEYNPIEKFFSEIKFYIRSKKNNHKKTCLINNINKSFNYVNKKNLKKYFQMSLNF